MRIRVTTKPINNTASGFTESFVYFYEVVKSLGFCLIQEKNKSKGFCYSA